MRKLYIILLSVFILAGCTTEEPLSERITGGRVLYLINETRLDNGLEPLVDNYKLTQVARSKIDEMLDTKILEHTKVQGRKKFGVDAEKNNYRYSKLGENLAKSTPPVWSVQKQHHAWLDSPSQREVMLMPDYKDIGIVVATDSDGTVYTVTEYGLLR